MKKFSTRAISLFMAVVMLIGVCSIMSFAETNDTCDCGHCPVIILPGINHSPTYLYDDKNEPVLDKNGDQIGGTLLIIAVDRLLDEVLPKAIFNVLGSLLLQRDLGLTDAVYKAACTAFGIQACDKNGDMVNNLQTKRWNYPLSQMTDDEVEWVYRMVPMKSLVDAIGENHTYFFTFNLVGNPMDSADDLDEYIDMVREQTGHDKVNLIPVSLGGTILTAYLDSYGHDKINEIVGAVACLDGTDIIADMMDRKFNLSDNFLYHEFIASIFEDSEGYGTYGYLINTALRILPRDVVNGVLTAAMSGILDTMIINCPQFWAMVPSDRYNALAQRYLTGNDYYWLREKTDRFQQARLNLKDNILAAADDGVEVSFIAGSGLNFGDQEYPYFAIMDSANKVNSDGIINLESTTLGAFGAVNRGKLPENYTQRYTNPAYPDYSYLSPDGSVDVSTAVLPDNTWIFLGQHHEVGNNDVVLNLAKSLLLNEVNDVHSNPEKWPQFNYSCHTKSLRRWLVPDAKKIDPSTLSAEDAAELSAAIAQAEEVLGATIADEEKAQAAEKRLTDILVKIGAREAEKDTKVADSIGEAITKGISWVLLKLMGGKGFFDVIVPLFEKLLGGIL